MKTLQNIALSLLAGMALLTSCVQKEAVYSITADRTAITDVPAATPGTEAIVITTDAPYWIVTTPS